MFQNVSFLCRALKEEKYAARRAILPVLQAEEDERYMRFFHEIYIITQIVKLIVVTVNIWQLNYFVCAFL